MLSVLAQGLRMSAVGVAGGMAGAAILGRLLGTLLYEVKQLDPMTFAGGALLTIGVALFACYVPARRATAADPIQACEASDGFDVFIRRAVSSSLLRHPKPIPKPEAAAVATKRKLKKQSPQQVVPIESRSADTAVSTLFAGHKHYCILKDLKLGRVSDIRTSGDPYLTGILRAG